LGEDLILVKEVVVAGSQIFDGDSHHAIEMLVDLRDADSEFLPENLMLHEC
jgi:hypothetical protein